MTERTIGRSALALALSVALPAAGMAQDRLTPPGDLPFGVYDPEGMFAGETDVQIEHLFLPWQDVFLESLVLADDYAASRGRAVLVTVEPWTWTRDERNTAEYLIAAIDDGTYDPNMSAICEILDGFRSPVTIRWAQEMEDASGQFIWAGWEPEVYIRAYRRMVDVCRAASSNIDFMWSPLGYQDLAAYYPGDEYVDVVGLSVFGYQPWEEEILGRAQNFRDILTPRYERAVQLGKPIVVAELGFSGDQDYVDRWIDDVRQDIADFPELRAVVYFNQPEVYPWPDGYGLPDWRFGQHVIE